MIFIGFNEIVRDIARIGPVVYDISVLSEEDAKQGKFIESEELPPEIEGTATILYCNVKTGDLFRLPVQATPDQKVEKLQKEVTELQSALNAQPYTITHGMTSEQMAQVTLERLSNDCQIAIVDGYWANVDGENRFYGYSLEDQLNLKDYILDILQGGTRHYMWKEKGGIPKEYTPEQIKQLWKLGGEHKEALWIRYFMEFKAPIEQKLAEGTLTAEWLNSLKW